MYNFILLQSNNKIYIDDIDFLYVKKHKGYKKVSQYYMLVNNKIPIFVGNGIIVDIQTDKIIIDIEHTNTENTINRILEIIDINKIYKYIHMKHNKNLIKYKIGDTIQFFYEITINYFLNFLNLEFELRFIKKEKLPMYICLKYLQFTKLLNSKRMIEYVFHPENVDFDKLFEDIYLFFSEYNIH